MPDRRPPSDQAVRALMQAFLGLSPRAKLVVIGLVVVGALVYFVATRVHRQPPTGPGGPGGTAPIDPSKPGEYLLAFWNIENFFDDHEDQRNSIDTEYDKAFAQDPALLAEKLDHVSTALVAMNNGAGPDLIGCAEVETVRAAELLKDALNRKLDAANAAPGLRYTRVAMKDLNGGRHIAPALITRLPVDETRTRLRGRQLRVLETHVVVNGHDLCLVVSHWTSQLRQKSGGTGESGRANYATTVSDVYADLARADAKADFLVCGDFNDTPDSESVVHDLHATGDRNRVLAGGTPPPLLDLLAGKDPRQFGTIWHNGPLIYDHICVSAGLLDARGWGCDPDSVRTVTDGLTAPGATRREPWRFDSPKHAPRQGRGFSDHFPVTVKLTVAPAAR